MKTTLKVSTLLVIILVVSIAFLNSCKKDDNETPPGNNTVPNARVEGVVLSPNGKAIGAAKVIAGTKSTKSDANGYFRLEIPAGSYNLIIQTGTGHLFKTTIAISVESNQQLMLTPSQTELQQVGTLAYIPGEYDNIQAIIIDTLGYSASQLSVYALDNFSLISNYDALFLNCGALEISGTVMNTLRYNNLLNFLQNHGSIYASDYAVEMLTGDGFMMTSGGNRSATHTTQKPQRIGSVSAPCVTPQLGGFLTDTSLCTSKQGPVIIVSNATVLDPDLAQAIGTNAVNINYDLENWEVVSTYGPPMNLIINDGNVFGPLALRSDPFSPEYGGIIFYTTFHNEIPGVSNPHVQKILQYFILNL